MSNALHSVRSKVYDVCRELGLESRLGPSESASKAKDKIREIIASNYYPDVAEDIASHLTEWTFNTAFVIAINRFPERFTAEEVEAGLVTIKGRYPNRKTTGVPHGIGKYFSNDEKAPCCKFTERARIVTVLAEQFARDDGVRDISPEHLLRGIGSAGRGVGRIALEKLELDLLATIHEVANLSEKSDSPITVHSCDFSPSLREVLAEARRAKLGLRHNHVGTEHLILGLLAQGNSIACKFLTDRGVTLDSVKTFVIDFLGGGRDS